MTSQLAAIPEELRNLPQWLVWRYEIRDGKPTKVPYRPDRSGARADATAADTWGTYKAAVNAAAGDSLDGVGFVFTAGDPYSGVDFDHCVDGDTIDPHVLEAVNRLDSYSELSVSGTGVHVIVRATTLGRCRTSKTPWGGDFENYSEARYFCMSGRHIAGTPGEINARRAELDAVRAQMFPRTPIATRMRLAHQSPARGSMVMTATSSTAPATPTQRSPT